MAKKILVGDPFFPDDSLNLPDFDFDLPEPKNDRSPVSGALRGVKDGVKSAFRDSSFIKRLLRETLPPVYGEIENIYSESTEGLKKLYNSAAKEIKPELNYLSKSVDRLVPAEQKKIKGALDKITKATKRDDAPIRSARDESNQRDNNLAIELGRVFSQESVRKQEIDSQQRGEERIEGRIKDSLDLGRHRDTIETLSQISMATQSMSKYQQKITNAYQRKSLEIQMRSYWLAADAHVLQKASAEKMQAQLEAVTKNTSLPEYVKIQKSEAWKEQLRNRFITDMNVGLFGKHSNFVRNVFDGLSIAAKDKAMNAASMFSQGAALVGTASDVSGMGGSRTEMAGDALGTAAAQSLAFRAGRKLKKHLNKNTKVGRVVAETDYTVRNIPQIVSKYANTPSIRGGILGGAEGILKSALSSGVRSLSPDVRLQTDNALNINPDTKGSLRSPSVFNAQTNKSINEIIPGYLSRIFRELQVMRTGDNTVGLTNYDFTKNRFLDSAKVSRNILKSVITPESKEAHENKVSRLMEMIGGDKELTKEERSALGSFLTKQNIKGKELSPETLVDKKFYDKSESSDIDSEKVAGLFRSYFKADPRTAKGYRFSRRKNEINSAVGELGKDFNDSRALIQELVNLGQYDVLRNAGLIDEKNNKINLETIIDAYGSEGSPNVRTQQVGGRNTSRDIANNTAKGQNQTVNQNITGVLRQNPDSIAAQTEMAEAIKSLVGGIGTMNQTTQTRSDAAYIQNVQNDNFELISKNTETTNKLLGDIITLLNDKLKIVVNRFSRGQGGQDDQSGPDTRTLGDRFRDGVGNIGEGISDAYNNVRGRVSGGANNFRRNSTLGRVIGGAAGMVGSGLSTATDVSKFWWKSTAKPLAKFAGKAVGAGGKFAAEQIIQMRDVYIDGEDEPRLLLRKFKAGQYFDAKTGEVVKTLRQLKNGVVDELGNVVLTKAEAAKAYTRNIKGGILPVLGQVFKSTFGAIGAVNSSIINNVLTPSLRAALTVTKKSLSFGRDLFDRPTDIYVKGDSEPTLLALTMRGGGYISKALGKAITKPSQIDGPVLDKEGNVVLTDEMLKKGIVDKFGNSVGSPLVNFARFAVSGVRAALKIGGKFVRGVNNVMGGIVGGAGGLMGDFFSKLSTSLGGGKSYDVLVQIRDVLNSRLPQNKEVKGDMDGDGIRDGSSAAIRRKRRANRKTGLEDDPTALKGGLINSGRENTIDRATRYATAAKDKIAGWLGFGDDDGDGIDIDVDGRKRKGGRGSRGGRSARRAERAGRTGRAAGRTGRIGKLLGGAKAAGARIGRTKGYKAGLSAGKKLGSKALGLGRRAGTAVAGTGVGSKVLGAAGKIGLGGAAKMLGAAGVGYGLYSAYDNASQGNYGSAALDLGLAGVGGATMLGGTAALGGIGSAALGAGGAIAGGLGTALTAGAGLAGTALAGAGALLASPVVLGALAVGALGYGAYKLYKYLNKANMEPMSRLRMAQYGFGKADMDYIPKVQAFEKEMIQYVKYDGDQPTLEIDDKKAGKLITFFDFEAKDSVQLNSWISWVQNRFKPVFLTHLAALKSMGIENKLFSIDSEKTDVLKKYFDLVKFPNGPYGQLDSPFPGLKKLEVGHALVNYVVSEVQKEIDKKVEEDKVNNKSTLDGGSAVALTTAAAKQKLGLNGSPTDEIDSQAIDKANESMFSKFVKTAKDKVLMFVPVMAAASAMAIAGKALGKWMGYAVDADEAVRFKTYGLIEMDRSKVVALRNLEEIVSANVKFSADGKAIWEGSISDVLAKCKGDFSITSKASPEAKAFVTWFTERFSTTYLYYRSLLKQSTGTLEQDKAEKALKPEERSDIAVKLAALEVWSKQISPWTGYILSTDASSTKPNLKLLQDAAKDSKLNEKKASGKDTPKPTGLAAALNKKTDADTPEVKPVDATKFNSQDSKTTPSAGGGRGSQGVSLGEDGPIKIGDVPGASGGGGGAGGIGKTASGPLVDGVGGDAGLVFYNNAKLDGVNPSMLKLFKGMAQEYYEATGKKIQVNSGYRSTEEQTALHKSNPAAARPGRSLHEFGLAIDIQSEHANALDKLGLMRKYGFTRPVGGEPWHIEMAGTQLDIAGSKKDPTKATSLIDASPGKGGGGWGTNTTAGMYSRNNWFAKELYHKGTNSSSLQDQEKAGEKTSTVGQNDLANTTEAKSMLEKIKSNGPAGGGVNDAGNRQKTSASGSGSGGAAGGVGVATGDKVANDNDSKPGQADGYKNTTGTGKGKGYMAVKDTISEASRIVGVDEKTMVIKAALESSFNPTAQAGTSSAAGLYQFTNSTWNEMMSKYAKQYGIPPGTSRNDARANSLLAAQYMKDNDKRLTKARNGGAVNATDRYMAHFFGPGGASSMIKADPKSVAADVLPAAAGANKSTFYKKDGTARTVAEVRELLDGKIAGVLKKHGIDEKQFASSGEGSGGGSGGGGGAGGTGGTATIPGTETSAAANVGSETKPAYIGNKNPNMVKASFKEATTPVPTPTSVSPIPLPANRATPEAQAAKERERQRMQLSDAIRPSTNVAQQIMTKPQPQLVAEARSMSGNSDEVLRKQLTVQEGMLEVLKGIMSKMDLSDIKAALGALGESKAADVSTTEPPTPDQTGNYNMKSGSTGRPKSERVATPIDFSRMT